MKLNQKNKIQKILKIKQKEYGSFDNNMKNIGASWSILLKDYLKKDIPGFMVALMYVQAKLIRASYKFKEDSYIDAEVYLKKAKELAKKFKRIVK
jgi:hypothetical protein|tara:strand:+ start:2386 stop:2670 length:285 start_codon:yes stop_codon:yes gene_type:complete